MKMCVKILIGAIIVVIVLAIAGAVLTAYFINFNNSPKGKNPEVIESNNDLVKKALIVYQPSKSDVSSFAAHQIGKALNEQGYEVVLDYPGNHLSTDISEYSIIVFGSPVYGSKTSVVLSDYIKKVIDFSDKKVILYSVGGLTWVSRELDEMETCLGNTKAYKKVKFKFYNKAELTRNIYDLVKNID